MNSSTKDKLDNDALFKSRNKTDLSMDLFTTISGVRGNQFGKDVYSTVLKFKDLEKFLDVFPAVQRNLVKSRIHSIKRYILSGLDSDENNMRFFSSITVTCKGTIIYDDIKQRIAIDTRSKLSINDGQHRFASIKGAIEDVKNMILKSEGDTEETLLKQKLEELKNMVIPVIIFDGLSEKEEKQLFHDLNNLARRPSRSANIRLSQTDLFAKISRELAEENRYLKHYGVEMDRTSIHKNNKNTVLLTSLHTAVKGFLGVSYWIKTGTDVLTEENYEKKKEELNKSFDNLFYSLPNDINVKGKYIIDKSFSLKGILKFYTYAKNELKISEDEIFKTISKTNFSNDANEWSEYGGINGNNGNVVFGGSSAGINAVHNKLLDNYKKSIRIGQVKDGVYVKGNSNLA